jgi:taurine dioxygenase
MGLEIRSLSDVMAAEAVGVDLKAEVSASERVALRQAVTDHLVLCIRGQNLSPTELAEASSLFGEPKTFVLRNDRIEDAPEVSIVTNRPPSLGGKPLVQAKHWHTDDSYLAEPATLTLLHAVTLPEAGGDTEFINSYAVLDALPPDLRDRVDGLRAVHKYLSRRNESWVAKRSGEEEDETPDVDHPLIRTHPLSGRRALYINPNRIDHILGWDDQTSDALLDPLYEFAFQPRFQYRHYWKPGDLVIWDNRCTMHRANAEYDLTQLRIMHRVMLEGEIPE